MEVYRLANANFVSLDGKGGIYGSGRWHYEGNLTSYAASSRALAVLERFVHDTDSMSVPNLKMVTIHIPDELAFEQIFEENLPNNWDTIESANQSATQDIGTRFLKSMMNAYLKVPSAIVPHEFNYVLNPLHPDAKQIKIIQQHSYQYDPRYKCMIKGDN